MSAGKADPPETNADSPALTPAASPSVGSLWDLIDLGEELRRSGFRIATQQCVAAEQVLMQLASDARLGDDKQLSVEQIVEATRFLGPIFCCTPEQQQRFPSLLDDWVARRAPALGIRLPSDSVTRAGTQNGASFPPPLPKLGTWRVMALAVSVLVAIGLSATGYGIWRRFQSDSEKGDSQKRLKQDELSKRPVPPPILGVAIDSSDAMNTSTEMQHFTDVQVTRDFELKPEPPPLPWRATAAPLVVALAWLTWTSLRRRRPALQRLLSRTPAALRDVHIAGSARSLLSGLPIRQTAIQLRHRVRVASHDLDTPATLAATLNGGGLLTPVFGSRVEPDYLVLIDRCNLLDHHAHLADEIVATLSLSNVSVDKYYFDGDPRICLPADFRFERSSQGHAHRLDELLARHSSHRVLIFTDGAGFFDPYTGEPSAWLNEFDGGRPRVVVTPVEVRRWGRREWSIERLGFPLLPLTSDGITVLGQIFSEHIPKRQPAMNRDLRTASFARSAHRWLERSKPRPEVVRELMDDLQHEFSSNGFLWLAACAFYPEVHWGITLRTGVELVSDPREFERLLPRICRLIWFREGFMPDWFRAALLEGINPHQRKQVRDLVLELLSHATNRPDDSVPLRISVDRPRAAGTRPTWLDRLNDWWRRRAWVGAVADAARGADDYSLLRDYVFLRFLSGQSLDALAPRAPRTLLQLLFPQGVPILGLRRTLIAASAVVCSAAAWFALALHPPTLVDFSTSELGSDLYASWSDGSVSRWTRHAPKLPDVAWQRQSFAIPGPNLSGSQLTVSRDGSLFATWGDGRKIDVWRVLDASDGPKMESMASVVNESPATAATFVMRREGELEQLVLLTEDTVRVWQWMGAQFRQLDESYFIDVPIRAIATLPHASGLLGADDDGKIWRLNWDEPTTDKRPPAAAASSASPFDLPRPVFAQLLSSPILAMTSALTQPQPQPQAGSQRSQNQSLGTPNATQGRASSGGQLPPSSPINSIDPRNSQNRPLRPTEIPLKLPVTLDPLQPKDRAAVVLDTKQKVMSMAVDPTGRLVAIVNSKDEVRLWNLKIEAPVGQPIPHSSPVKRVKFLPSSVEKMSLAVATSNGSIQVWSVEPVVAKPISRQLIYFTHTLRTVPGADADNLIAAAFASWQRFCDVSVYRTENESQANVIIEDSPFEKNDTPETRTDLGPPRDGQVIRMRLQSSAYRSESEFTRTVVREIGHLLGLSDSTVPGQLMNLKSGEKINSPQSQDIDRLHQIWGQPATKKDEETKMDTLRPEDESQQKTNRQAIPQSEGVPEKTE